MRSTRVHARTRHGASLAELIVVIAMITIILGFVLAPVKRGYDRIKTRGAAREAMTVIFAARFHAIASARRTAVIFDESRGRVVMVATGDTLMMRPVAAEHGVTLTATRDSMAFFPDGLGLGGANLSVIVRRGSAADTVFVSREGRARLGTRIPSR